MRDHYRRCGRDLPWRHTTDPYAVLVSEIMLQQTQVARVCVKFREFMTAFPDPAALAVAPPRQVLAVWQGMGYNRRALALQRAAQAVMARHGGRLPADLDGLTALPGIGPATAADILAFAFNKSDVVIETNIRAVFIHLFFPGGRSVPDVALAPLVARTMDRRNPRDWYNGLMDLGTAIKRLHGNPARRSAHHVRQSAFEGANRQLRSRILKLLLATTGGLTAAATAHRLDLPVNRVRENMARMAGEGLLRLSHGKHWIS